jgi:hypothetical protein
VIWKSRLQVAKMSTTPAERMEPSRDNPDGRISVCARPENHSRDGEAIHCFSLGAGT